MIERLSGTVFALGERSAVIEIHGVGFRVHLSSFSRARLRAGDDASLVVRTLAHREDAVVLYGFVSDEEARLFDQVRAVGGVGPTVALNLLALSPAGLVRGIREKDVKRLQAAPGVGARLARRLITELAEALPDDDPAAPASEAPPPDPRREQLVTGLTNLQFTDRRRVSEVVEGVLREMPEAEAQDLFKAALGRLSNRGLS